MHVMRAYFLSCQTAGIRCCTRVKFRISNTGEKAQSFGIPSLFTMVQNASCTSDQYDLSNFYCKRGNGTTETYVREARNLCRFIFCEILREQENNISKILPVPFVLHKRLFLPSNDAVSQFILSIKRQTCLPFSTKFKFKKIII